MTDRYDLLVTAMREAAHTVTIIAGVALATLAARWSIKYIPRPLAPIMQNLFDLWLVACILILFVVSK